MNDNIVAPEGFRHTGTSVPVRQDVFIDHVTKQLEAYDYMVKTNQQPPYSPYDEPILFETEDKKILQVPEDIQKYVVNMWNQQKQNMSQNQIVQQMNNLPQQQLMVYSENKKKPYNNYLKYIVVLLVLLVCVGGYYLYKKNLIT